MEGTRASKGETDTSDNSVLFQSLKRIKRNETTCVGKPFLVSGLTGTNKEKYYLREHRKEVTP